MKPVQFKGQSTVLAKDQDEYMSLPVHVDTKSGSVAMTSCHKLTWRERWLVLLHGKIWNSQLTFGNPYHPVSMSVEPPPVVQLAVAASEAMVN